MGKKKQKISTQERARRNKLVEAKKKEDVTKHTSGRRFRWVKGKSKFEEVGETENPVVHAVHEDTLLDPIESMATPEGKKFDSKSAYKKHLAEHGYEITGGDHLTGKNTDEPRKIKDWREEQRKAEWGMRPPDDITAALREQQRKIKWGMAPKTEEDEAKWKEEERKYRAHMSRNL